MAKVAYLIILLMFADNLAFSQTVISGRTATATGEGIAGVSIACRDSYDGTTSGPDGTFSFQVGDTGRYVLQFTVTGFKPLEKDVHVTGAPVVIDVVLKKAITDLQAVVIMAGTFEAGDKKRTTVLKSVDLVTTAGQQADIVAALRTLPGAQQIGEQEGLFVRGGTGEETRVFIDGMMVTNPFFSSVPGIAQRGRFSPLLFKGTAFSSGGYSAQYGQALSSVLVLESIDLPSRSEVNMIISSPQVSLLTQKLAKSKDASTGINVNYMNLAPYFGLVRQKYHYIKSPEALNTEFNYRRKTRSGIFKFYGYAGTNQIGFERPGLDFENSVESFRARNYHAFTILTFTTRLPHNWQLYGGASFSFNQDEVQMRTAALDTTYSRFHPRLANQTLQSKLVFSKSLPGLTKICFGTEVQQANDRVEAPDSIDLRKIVDTYIAGFAEADIYYSAKLVSRAGARFEYSSREGRTILSPRVSLAYKVSDHGQFSFACGMFNQEAGASQLLRNPQLQVTRATHCVFNYQKNHKGRTLRLESFYKRYRDLVTLHNNDPADLRNEGTGYARGIELFWRDKTSVKNLDYWVSYSYLDTRRKYLDYPSSVQPSFAATHTASVVAKSWVEELSTQFSATYSFASGRPYFNPNRPSKDFMSDRTIACHSLGLQANYLRTFRNINAVFIVNIGNVLGFRQVFAYRYANAAGANGQFNREAVTPMARRFIFLGVYLSIGADRRKAVLD